LHVVPITAVAQSSVPNQFKVLQIVGSGARDAGEVSPLHVGIRERAASAPHHEMLEGAPQKRERKGAGERERKRVEMRKG
jgi:hypothetical protein